MIKALMIITMVSGATYEVKLPSMEQCVAQKTLSESQNDVASTARVFHELMTECRQRFSLNSWICFSC